MVEHFDIFQNILLGVFFIIISIFGFRRLQNILKCYERFLKSSKRFYKVLE